MSDKPKGQKTWRVEAGTHCFYIVDEQQTYIARIPDTDTGRRIAPLIAAAPELLEACENMVKQARQGEISDWHEAIEVIEAAIAKATGETLKSTEGQ